MWHFKVGGKCTSKHVHISTAERYKSYHDMQPVIFTYFTAITKPPKYVITIHVKNVIT